MTGAMQLGPRFGEALAWALELHGRQVRKGGSVPYVSHLLAVAALVLEAGGGEDEAIAALLHDAVEDQGIPVGRIRDRFGPRVAAIVDGCSDTGTAVGGERGPANSFVRKAAYVDHLRSEDDPGVLRVSVADKLHNARAILADHRLHGDALWGRFNVGRLGQLWYYRELVRAFAGCLPGDPQVEELARVVAELRRRAGDPSDEDLDREVTVREPSDGEGARPQA